MCLQDGYKLIRAAELVAALTALAERRITFRAFRAYVACFELVARREAAERSGATPRRTVRRRFVADELRSLIEPGEGSPVARELSALRSAGLLHFSTDAIESLVGTDVCPESRELLGGRALTRQIPVPRQVLRFVARCRKPAVAKTVVAYLLRGLALDRSGAIRNKGTVKVSCICRICGVSERAARTARAELIRLGWITRDTDSVQRKLNRDGAYFVINTGWRRVPRRSAPLRVPKRTESAPPRERQETPSDLKDQKPETRTESGVRRTEGRPDLRNIQTEDLRRLSRLRELHRQAAEAGWIERGEAAFLKFAAAAVRATRAAGDPVRVFVGIVRGRLWHFITLEQEARAAEVIRRDEERTSTGSVIQAGATTINVSQLLRSMAA